MLPLISPPQRGPFVYRLGRQVFNLERGVRFPYGLPFPLLSTSGPRSLPVDSCGPDGLFSASYVEQVVFEDEGVSERVLRD